MLSFPEKLQHTESCPPNQTTPSMPYWVLLIMEKTGHYSLEGVQSYKRTSCEQQESLTDILSLTKKPHLVSAENKVTKDVCSELVQPHTSSSAAVQNLQQSNSHA